MATKNHVSRPQSPTGRHPGGSNVPRFNPMAHAMQQATLAVRSAPKASYVSGRSAPQGNAGRMKSLRSPVIRRPVGTSVTSPNVGPKGSPTLANPYGGGTSSNPSQTQDPNLQDPNDDQIDDPNEGWNPNFDPAQDDFSEVSSDDFQDDE